MTDATAGDLETAVVEALVRQGLTVATAESLTGGLVCAALTTVAGSSAVVRGGVVAYATDLKASVLGVSAELLSAHGAVHPQVALQMAHGVCGVAGSRVGIATTGVAGPTEQDGQPVGTVFVAVVGPTGEHVERLSVAGDRQQVREASVKAALGLLLDSLTAAAAGKRAPDALESAATPESTPEETPDGGR